MNINETLMEMLTKDKVGRIVMGLAPNKSTPFVSVEYQVTTGAGGDMTIATHQREGDSITECLQRIRSDMDTVQELATKVIRPR